MLQTLEDAVHDFGTLASPCVNGSVFDVQLACNNGKWEIVLSLTGQATTFRKGQLKKCCGKKTKPKRK